MPSALMSFKSTAEERWDDSQEVSARPLVAPSSSLPPGEINDKLVMKMNLGVERFHRRLKIAELRVNELEEPLSICCLANWSGSHLDEEIGVHGRLAERARTDERRASARAGA